jgi:hypothetical protein
VTIANDGGLATPVTVTESPDVPWLAASLSAASVGPGGTSRLTLVVDTSGLTAGTIGTTTLRVSSASGRAGAVAVPVRLVVPAFQIALDAGSRMSHVDAFGDTWSADAAFSGTGCGYLGNASVVRTGHTITGTADPARFAHARQDMYEYRCAGVPDGPYLVELDFAEVAGLRPNRRVFDVLIEGVLVLPSQDIALDAGPCAALTRSYPVTVADGTLSIRFITHSGFSKPIVSAVRVTHRPDL